MKGTEKQIKFAEDIKARLANRVTKVYASDDESKTVIEKALEFIDRKYDDAAYWIETEKNRSYENDLYLEWFCEMTEDPEMQKIF